MLVVVLSLVISGLFHEVFLYVFRSFLYFASSLILSIVMYFVFSFYISLCMSLCFCLIYFVR